VAVHLVRHASAGTRHPADGHDAERRLDARGGRQADALVDLLAGAGVVWIASSPARRCVETMVPLADHLGLQVAPRTELYEGTAVERAWLLVVEAASLDGDAVLCSHGDVIPDLLRRAQLRGMDVPGRSGCAKGSCWTLSGWDGERFARGDYRPNPR
jgi:8-oxo-dGTP diphosphatase